MSLSPLSQEQKKQFRKIGHQLKPVVTISDNGFSEGVWTELERALEDHELIKVKCNFLDRDDKAAVIEAICDRTGAVTAQTIGKVALLYRPAKKPNPKLSNILRYQTL